YASAQHALLTWREGQWWLEDLGSRNGTQLNDELVDAPTVVVTGDIIRIGRARLKVELDYGPGVTEQDGASNRLEPGPGEGAGDPTDTGG
ncbi:MAG: FHA domain-containing protein, partial [Anaerolineales bacterium]|nr:FHA domain-containing protein [Anaerolineales bacterium]